MKLLLTTDTVGGIWTYALELARALEPRGVEIALATMGLPLNAEQWEAARRLPNVEVFESAYKLEWMEDPWEDVHRAGEWLLEIEDRFRPDVAHLNSFVPAALPWRAPKLVVGHSCVLSWWRAVRGEEAPENWDRYRCEVARGLRAADLVAAPTTAMLTSLQRHYGPFRAQRVLYNGRDPALYWPGRKEPFVLTAGRIWDEAKNVGAVDCIAADLDWPVYIAGEQTNPDGGGFRAADSVRPLGRLAPPILADWYARAAIYALPARYEPFGLSILEAALAGCALVLGDIPSLREIWGDAALFVSPDDIAGLRSALQTLIQDATLRQKLAERARQRALPFTAERMADRYMESYALLMARNAVLSPA